MNKIFKIIWSKARNCYVVVSELAKSHDDGHVRRSRGGCCRKAAVLAAFVLTMSLAVVPVWAADSKGNINNVVTINNNQPDRSAMDGNNNLNGNNNVVYGTGNTADKSGAVIVGKNSKGDQDSVVIGNNAQSNAENQIIIGHGIANSTAKGSIIIGNTNNTVDTSQSVLIGNNTKANGSGKGIVIIGNGAMADSEAAGYTDNGGTYIPAGIVLGEYSYSNTRAGKEGFLSNKKGDKPSPAFTDEYWNAVWKATANPMAIGNADTDANGKGEGHNGHGVLTRQITGVAAGTDLTDAVNVAQLQAAMAQFSGGGSGTGGDGVHFYSVKETDSSKGNYNNEGATGTDALAAGVDAKATGNYATAVGNNAQALKDNAVAIGNGAVANGTGATVIGQYAKATGDYATAFGGKHYYDARKGEVTLINEASGIASTAFGEGNKALGEASLAFGLNTQAGTEKAGQQSVAFGEGTKALGGRSLAFGERTLASFTNSVAFGADTQARSNGATAFGSRTRALAQYSTAMGNRAVAAGNYAVAFGTDTIAGVKTDESGALTLINKTKIDSNGNIAYVDGQGKTYAVHDYSVNGGETHDYVVVTGTDGKQYIQDYRGNIHAVTIDDKGVATASTEVAKNITLNVADPTSSAGYTLESYDNATAFGQQTKATNKNATAFGQNSEASGEASTAFGIGSKAEGKNSLAALGGLAANDNSIAIGEGTKANNTDKAVSVAIGQNAEASGERSLAIGFGVSEKVNDKDDKTLTSTKASGESAIAIGTDVVAKGQHSVAMGSHTDAAKDSSVAIGFDTHTVSDSAVAIGSGTRAEGRYSVALGLSSVAGKETNDAKNPLNGGGSVAIGYGTSAEASRSVAIGTGATAANAEFTTALGDSANAQQRGSVAIGTGSVATRAAGNKEGGTEYKEAYLIPDVSQATEAEKATWTSTEGAVSVGGTAKYQDYDENGNKVPKTKLLTRQITNVAAGSLDTDAVNVAQLKQVQTLAGKHTAVTVDGKAPQDTTYVGDNLKLNVTDLDGQKTYDLKLNDTLNLGRAGKDGKDGVDGSIGLKGADGKSSIGLNGKDGISVIGADGKNGVSITGSNGKGGLDGKIAIGTPGKDGQPGKDAVSLSGKDGVGHIGLTGPKGADGQDGAMIDISTVIGQATLDKDKNSPKGQFTGAERITYTDSQGSAHEVATMDDGQKYGGDNYVAATEKDAEQNVITKKLNERLDIHGGADKDNLSENNIGVNAADGVLKVQLAKKIDLTKDGSVTMGNTTINNAGMTITKKDGDKTTMVSLTDKGLDNGGNKITNVAAGTNNTDAVNVSQLNDVKTLAGKHTAVTVDGKAPQDTTYVGDNLKLNVTDLDGQKTYDLKLNDTLNLGRAGKDGKDGVDGSIGLKGADGKSSIGLNGKDGISVIGADGKNGVSITGSNGKGGLDGKIAIGTPGKDGQPGKDAVSLSGKDGVGHIGLTGPKGADGQDGAMIDISTVIGQATLDKDKNSPKGQFTGAERITYTDSQGSAHEVATMDDGQKYGGDNYVAATEKDAEQNVITKKLNERLDIHGGADKDNLSENNIGVNAADGVLKVQLAKKIDLTKDGSVTMGNTTINNAGMTITKKDGDKTTMVSLTDKGLDNGGNKITNVAAGTNNTDAVNVSQLNDVKTLAGQHTTVEAGSKNITVKADTNSTGGKKYTVDLAKDVTFGDAAKGDKTVAISGTNGTITAGTGDNKVTVDGSKGQIVAGGDNGVKIGNIENGDSSLTIYDKDGNAKGTDKAGKYVTNLDNKTWNTDGSYVSGRAATEDQLHQVESNVNKKFDDVNKKIENVDKHHTEVTVNGGTVAPTVENTYSEGNLQIAQKTGADGQKIYDLKLSDNLNIGGAGKDGAPGKDGHMGINGADGKSGVGIDGKDGISIKGKDGQNGVTIKGVDGKDGTEGHIGLTGPKGADGQNATADIHVKNGQNGGDGTDGHGGKDGMDRVVYEDHNHITHEVATMDDGMKYSGDSGNAAVKLNKNVQIYGGATEYADGNNIGVVASQDGDNAKLQVKLAKDLKGINSIDAKTITTGNTTINNGGLTIKTSDDNRTITVQDGNVNMGGNKIEGVADGKVSKDSTDAVNGSQLWQRDQAINGLSGSVNKLGNRINRVGAGAAALAALHPLDFDPDDKWDFAAGYGNYRGANAAAIGAYYRPNEDTMFSVGGSFGGGENMVNAGVSIKLGQGNHVSTSRVAMAKEMKAMRQHMAEQDALIAKLQSMHGMAVDPAKSVLFPDVAENHWAYQYVTTLAKKGILEGYPDGEFKGDRMMTRYEFAAIVYRIVESGVGSTDPELSKLVKEFSPELQYIRIDTIQKDRNGKPTIERVRVISDAK